MCAPQTFGDAHNTFLILSAISSGRRVTNPQQVINILQYHSVPPLDSVNSFDAGVTGVDYDSMEAMWELSLARYLRGPSSPVEGSDARPPGDLTLRARKFMRAVTGSEYMPVDSMKIQVASFSLNQVYNTLTKCFIDQFRALFHWHGNGHAISKCNTCN
jgi:hypothetical protein